MLGDVDHANNPSEKHSLDHDHDHDLDHDHDHKPNKSLLNKESRKMSKAGENILGRGGRKTMDVAESRSSDEVGRGAADLDFVIDVTQTEPRSMSLQVIIYSPFSPVSPCFWTFQVFCFRFILRLITQSLLISTPDMLLLQSEKVRHQRRFGPFFSLFY